MKIIFAGTPLFSAFHLDLIIRSKNKVSAVLTQPDRKSGRGKKLKSSPVKVIAKKNQIMVFQPKVIKNDSPLIKELKAIEPDLILVVAYGLILPKALINLPRLGCINIHASLLPRWRGAAPMERSLLQGDTEGGITYMRMDEGLDTGPIMKSLPCPISLEENYESLEKKYQNLSKNELIKFLDDLADGRVREVRQDSERACYAEKIEKKETEIFWKTESEEFINRKIRALFPKYGAFTFMGDKRVKILSCCKAYISQQLSPGEIYVSEGEYLYAGCLDNKVLKIQLIQPEGKRAITGEDFIKGNREKISQIKKFSSSLEK